jgi:NIPSNAP protein
MAVEVHVTGRVQLGHFPEFLEASERWREFRAERGSAPCHVLHGLSGEMNLVRLVFSYPDAAAYEAEEARDAADPEYGRVASAMPFVEGTLAYEIYRVLGSAGDDTA